MDGRAVSQGVVKVERDAVGVRGGDTSVGAREHIDVPYKVCSFKSYG